MSRQESIHNYINTKLNSNTQNLKFKLYYKYGVNDGEFADLLLNSVDLGVDDENNVVVEYEGTEYNTQHGQFTLDTVKYIPCIIEDFQARFEPLEKYDIVDYTVPVSFFVDVRYNDLNGDIVTNAIESVQDAIRGTVTTIGGYNCFITHSDIRPISGIIEIGSSEDDIRSFRAYQMTFYINMNKQGHFGKEIQYFIQHESLFGGVATRFYPIGRGSSRKNENQSRQLFDTDTTVNFETRSVPDLSAMTLNFSLLYDGTELTRHFITQKFNQGKPLKYFFSVIYPGMEGTPFGDDYILEDVGGAENIDSTLVVGLSFIKASEKYNGWYLYN